MELNGGSLTLCQSKALVSFLLHTFVLKQKDVLRIIQLATRSVQCLNYVSYASKCWQRRTIKIEMDGFRVRRYRTFPFCVLSHFDSNTSDPMKTELSESQAEADEPTNHSGSSQAIR